MSEKANLANSCMRDCPCTRSQVSGIALSNWITPIETMVPSVRATIISTSDTDGDGFVAGVRGHGLTCHPNTRLRRYREAA